MYVPFKMRVDAANAYKPPWVSLVYVPLEIRVDAAMGNALQLSVCTLGDGEVFSSQAKLARTVAVLMCLGMRRCSRKMKSVSLYEF